MSNQVAAAISQEFLENCFTVSAQALCCYDFFLTFTREVQFMWKLKPSMASILFFTLRYPALCNTVLVVLGYLSWGGWQSQLMAGDVLVLTSSASKHLSFLAPPTHDYIFTAVRIYALSARSRWRLGFSLVLGLINPVMSTYTFVLSAPYLARLTPHYQTCDIDTQFLGDICEDKPQFPGMMCARASAVIFDAVALLLTWLSIKRVMRAGRNAADSESDDRSAMGLGTMTVVLMKDTAVYFGFLFAINALGIAIGLSHPKASPFCSLVSYTRGRDNTTSLVSFSMPMTSILLSRLMLDLRQANSKDSDGGTYISRALTTMVFDGTQCEQEGPTSQEDSFGSEESDGVNEVFRTP
ncbi:uncharacterized protein B0H18DRAFT_1120851 [Fomitopsis serialis]|uniref:uncharacterized protein n=1 Tax=Fomitopsis serialis TaxID=139415 RepID=UPI0020086F51|nr:uncharacterized protein B0H18DRAFT_1120851 [Neoantrodia serialis]KAH9922452.1 hypothetical protein B0H18DRAFT_1120851 [Neoantrodia serialis]